MVLLDALTAKRPMAVMVAEVFKVMHGSQQMVVLQAAQALK